MRAECMPTIKLEIRPMVHAIVQNMGIENSELSEAIRESVDYEIKKQILDIPNLVKNEVKSMFDEEIKNECDAYARTHMSPKWVQENPNMTTNFRNTIRTEVMIAVGKYIEENRPIKTTKKLA